MRQIISDSCHVPFLMERTWFDCSQVFSGFKMAFVFFYLMLNETFCESNVE